MWTTRRRLVGGMLVVFAAGTATAAYGVPFEELSAAKRARYTAEAAAVNVLPVASSFVEPKCLPGYIFCKATLAAFSVIAAGEHLMMTGGADMQGPRAILYRGFSGDWVVTPRDMAGDTKPDVLPAAPPPTGERKSGDFIPPPR